ncbi:hypothetical protein FGLOB1_6242 [Fusarium globosum]|uniref:Agglutinin-like protein 2 n=1 Tax=Fusarium globosum TaxID=78864 RepID=A0A8H5YA23_9HYPO|nr:hypothetical protein FGLOB1_6242 [Fusarium globosum]
MRPLYQVLRHLIFASLTRAQFGVQNDRSVLGINNEFSGVCYTYVSVYPVLADPDYITITKPYRGSVTTHYTVPPQGDEPGIVIVEQPGGSSAPENVVIPATDDRSYVIIIRPHSGPNPISAPITQVVPPRSGQPGQIIIETPETQGVLQPLTLEPKEVTGYVTVFRPLTGTLASLQLITISPTGANRGSVIINVPTSALNGRSLQGLTLEPAQDGDYVTVIEPAGTAFSGTVPIRLTIPPSNGNPGTVIIQTPVPGTLIPLALEPLTPNTLGALGLAGQTITLQPADATGYVTIIEPAEGSVTPTAPIRTTIPPTGTKPGTVLIQTPPGWNDGGDGAASQPTRTRPQGSVSYTTITRGVPMGMGGSDGGSNGGSGSGDVQGLPGQGGDDESGPRQTLTIPPEGGNPGTVIVLTPENPNNPQTSNNGGGDDGAQATGGSSGGNQGGSGGGSDSSGSGNGQSGSGGSLNNGESGGGSDSSSGSPSGQGGSSSNGGSTGGDDDPVKGGVQGSGSGSGDGDGDSASGSGGSSGSNNGNGSGNGGSSSSGGSSGSGGTQGGAQGGSDSEGGSGGSGTRSAGSSSSTKGASSGGSGSGDGPGSGDTESEGGGSEGGSDSGNGSSGGSGSTSGGKGSSGDGDGDSGSGGNNAGGANGGSGQSSSSRRGSTSGRPSTRSPIVRTSPSTYVVTSSSTVFTITADVVETLTAEPQRTRRSTSSGRLTGGVEGLGGSGIAATDRTTFRRPSNSRSTGSAVDTAGGADSGVEPDSTQTTQAPGSPSSTIRAGASSSSGYTGIVDTRVRPGGSGLSSTRSRTSTSGQASRSSNGETTIVDSGPVITNDPGSDAEEATSSVGNAAQSSSTRSAQRSSTSQSSSAQRPVAATSSSDTRFTARPAVISTSDGNAEAGGTSQATQRSSRAPSSVSGFVEGEPGSTAAGNNGGASSEDEEATSQASRASSGSQSTRSGSAGPSSASTRSSALNTPREGSSVSDAARGSSVGTSTASQGAGQSSSTFRTSEEINIETIIGTQSVPESERVEQPGDTSTRSATSSGAGLTGQPAAGVGGSTTAESNSGTTSIDIDDDATISSGEPLTGGPAAGATSGSLGESSVSDDSDVETASASRDPGSGTASDDARETGDATGTAQPGDEETTLISPQVPAPTDPLPESESSSRPLTGGVEGMPAMSDSSFESPELPLPTAISTGALPDSSLLSTATDDESSGAPPGFEVPTGSQAVPSDDDLDPGSGITATGGPTGSDTLEPNASSGSSRDEASETRSSDPDETGTGASTEQSQSASLGDGDGEGARTTDEAGAESSKTDADAESETSGPDATSNGSGSEAGPSTDEGGQTITDASGGIPTAGIPSDNDLTTEAPGGALATITVFRAGRGPARTTLYVPPQASNDPWTVVIETPVSETQSEAATARGDDDVLATTSAIGGNTNVTIFRAGSSPARRTLYVPPRFANEPGTIVIETPTGTAIATAAETGIDTPSVRPNITVYSSGTASGRITLYIPPTVSGEAGTVVIQTPVSDQDSDTITGGPGDESGNTATSDGRTAVTIYTEATGSTGNTRYISPTASGELGTYIIETLASEAGEETASDESAQATGPEASITPVPTDEGSPGNNVNVTLYRAGEGSERSTIFIPPETTGDPWTIVIETPISQTELIETGTVPGFQTTISAITGSANLTIFRAGVASTRNTIYVAPKTSGGPGTVIIETPVPKTQTGSLTANPEAQPTVGAGSNTTIFVPGTGPGRTTYYVPPSDPNDPGTVYVETPVSAEETEEPTDGPSATGDGQDTIVAATTFTIFSGGPGSVTRTVYVPPTASGEAGTLYIETPTGSATGEERISAARTVTVYTGVPGSVTRTVYVPPTAIGEPGTLFIETPVDGTQATVTNDENAISAATTVTIFSGGPGSVTRSVYVPPTASGEAGTMYIETPTDGAEATASSDEDVISAATTVTIFSGGPAAVTRTTYIPPAASGEAGTLVIVTPTAGAEAETTGDSNDGSETGSVTDAEKITAGTTVTIFSGGSGSVTRTIYIPPTVLGEAGTLIVETPTSGPGGDDSSITGTGVNGPTAIVTPGGPGNVTIYSGGPASSTTTRFIPPTASGEPGTIVIETPTAGPQATGIGNVTIITGGPATVTQTRYIPATVTDEPGTIVIETPTSQVDEDGGAGNTTIYSAVSATGTRTIYIPPTVSGEPGTIIIETPAVRAVTVYTDGPALTTRTLTIPGTASGDPDTILIETPTSGPDSGPANVTIYTGVSATVATTRFVPGTASDEPGTFIVETPLASPTYVTVYSGGSGTAVTTIYLTPSESGDSTTMIIQTPTQGSEESATDDSEVRETGTITEASDTSATRRGNVTIYTQAPGTAGGTFYFPPDDPEESGTIIIETLPGDAEETGAESTEGPVAPTVGGRVNTTIFSGGPVTAPRTLYISATISGEPDTVLIETPTTGPEAKASESATGQQYTTIFGGGSGTATRTITIPATVFGELDTILIETPTGRAPEVTITRGGPVSVATTITIPGAPGEPDTVLVEIPIESGDAEPSESANGPGEVTSTRGGPVTAATTITIPGQSGQPDTVIIETPTRAADVTITRGGPVSVATTVTIPGASGEPDTVLVETPIESADISVTGRGAGEITSTRGGPVTAATTITIPGISGQPDTVIVETPTTSSDGEESTATADGPVQVTSTRGGAVTAATTLTISGESGQPDIVIVETPTRSSGGETTGTGGSPGEVTSTRGGPVTAGTTITIPGGQGEPDTVIVETPTRSNEPPVTGGVQAITSTRGGPVTAATTITIPGESGQPDTVIVETPQSSDEDGPSATQDSQDEVTITRGGPVTAATTVTIPGVSGGPDTVFIETPTSNEPSVTGGLQAITSTRGGPVTAATTITIPGESGQPDTVIIETPLSSGEIVPSATEDQDPVTITRGGPVTAATTVTIPGVSGDPDTVFIETPTQSSGEPRVTAVQQVTITQGGPVTAPITVTVPGVSGGPDTVYIEVPTESAGTGAVREVTITRGGPVTAATTVTIPGGAGEPDTVYIETPSESAGGGSETPVTGAVQEVTITRGGPVTAAITVTIPGASGQPDTIIIETPTESSSEASGTNGSQGEVTITRGGPVTAATTITVPGLSGEPDTVIIETPTGTFETPNNALANVTVYSGGPVSVTRTIYFPPAASSEAGTIVIETPDGSSPTETARGPGNVTIYTGVAGTATRTVFIPATASGEPGTVLIETPTGSSGGERTTGSLVAITTGPLTTSERRPNTTIFSGGSGSSTRTIYFPPASDDPDGLGTIVIETPTSGSEEEDPEESNSAISTGGPANITRIVGGPASVTTTIYIPPTASGEPGVVIIETPTLGPEDETTTSERAAITAFPVGRQNVTLYSGGPGSVVTTIYYPPASSDLDEPGTVVIQTPTAGPEEETPSTSASEAVTPIQNITRIVGGPASVTTTIYIPPTASGEPGFVIIETPTASPEAKETSSASITATSSNEEATGIPNVTRYIGGPASITTTYTIPPASSGDPGTVIIQTPSTSPSEREASASETEIPNVTGYIGGPASVAATYTIPPASPGEPGTVVIQTPTASPEEITTSSPSAEVPTEVPNVTRYVGGPASVTTTYTLPPASSGEPGTVVIQTPSASPAAETTSSEAITSVESPSAIQNVTRFVGGPASVTTTIYIPPAASGEPGTVLIQTPSSAPEETSSSATTSTTRPPTVAQNTTIFSGRAGSTTRTIYIPPASDGEPGTVLIETPTASPAASTTPISGAPAGIPTTSTPIVAGTNVTIFRAAPPTATAERTLYDPPTAAGEPGTVIIETMVVSSTSGSAAPLSMEGPVITTLSGSSTSSSAIASPSSTSSSAAAAASSSSSDAAAAASSSSSAAAAAASSSSSVAAAASSSSAAAAAASSSSSSVAAAASSTSSAAPASITTSSTSAAPPVITTSSSAAVPVVATSSSSTSSTSMMPQLAFGPTFDCDGFGYTVQSLLANTLTRVNLVNGQRTDIRTGIGPGGPINGIGFNRLDNYIYGFYQQPLVNAVLCGVLGCKRSGLIRIAKDGRWEVLDLVIGTNAISMGDVDDQGRFWVSEGGGRWWCIDLRPTSTTFGKLLDSGTSATNLLSGVGDWAYVPGGGNYLYAVQASVIESGLLRTNIVRWSLTTQKWERFQTYPNLILTTLNLVWGAVMAAPDGTLFAQETVLGQTWKFTLGSAANPTAIPGGAILNLLGSDGARCAGTLVS